jgi:hypothetical protein
VTTRLLGRAAIVVSATLALGPVLSPVASDATAVPAAPATRVVTALPPGFDASTIPCSDGLVSPPRTVAGPSTAPRGWGTLALPGPAGTSSGFSFRTDRLPDVEAFSAWVRMDGPLVAMTIEGEQVDLSFVARGSAVYDFHDQWQHVDFTDSSFAVRLDDDPSLLPMTWDELTDLVGRGRFPVTVTVHTASCNEEVGGVVHVDLLRFADQVQDTTYDLEPARPPRTTTLVRASRATVGRGQAVTLTGTLRAAGRVSARRLDLYAGPRAARMKRVRSLTTDAAGGVRTTVRPRSTTVYQWRFAGVGNPSRSRAVTVKVKPPQGR